MFIINKKDSTFVAIRDGQYFFYENHSDVSEKQYIQVLSFVLIRPNTKSKLCMYNVYRHRNSAFKRNYESGITNLMIYEWSRHTRYCILSASRGYSPWCWTSRQTQTLRGRSTTPGSQVPRTQRRCLMEHSGKVFVK